MNCLPFQFDPFHLIDLFHDFHLLIYIQSIQTACETEHADWILFEIQDFFIL